MLTLVSVLALALATAIAAWWLTGQFYRSAWSRAFLDVPNERSSHVVATPRGGGVAVVLATLSAYAVLGVMGARPWVHLWGLIGGGAIAAAVGFADDCSPVRPLWRLLGHAVAAVWVLAWLGGVPPFSALGTVFESGWIGYGAALLYLLWALNLTNFMDGIDGLAAVEAISVCLGGVAVLLIAIPGDTQYFVPLVLAAATGGFLGWNWPPAKIFLGDVGSGFLGLTVGAISLVTAAAEPSLFWSWAILAGVFVVDASVTLLRRVLRGERIHEAHRSHAYQHAARRWASHLRVTVAVGVINICWLFPLAVVVGLGALDGLLATLIAYTPLVVAAFSLGAGTSSLGPSPSKRARGFVGS